MIENFLKLEEDKRNRILNAAFEVFAKNDYHRASTLVITSLADISKGSLFHYFGNKKNLYFYLYDIGVDRIMEGMRTEDTMKNTDFFSRMEELTMSKMRVMQANPYIYAYFVKVYIEEDKEVKKELNERLSQLAGNQSVMLKDIETYKFRKQVDLNLLCDFVVKFAVEFIQERLLVNEKVDMEELVIEFQRYLRMLKENFYKEEYL